MTCRTSWRRMVFQAAGIAGLGWIAGAAGAEPNLVVSEFTLDPPTPVRGEPVELRIGVYNRGGTRAGTKWRGGPERTIPNPPVAGS